MKPKIKNPNLEHCDYCGRTVRGESIVFQDSQAVACPECVAAIENTLQTNICSICCEASTCAFDDAANPLPKLVQQTVRQGNSTFITQVRNPQRVAALCPSCTCYDEEHHSCRRHEGRTYCNDFTLFLGNYYF